MGLHERREKTADLLEKARKYVAFTFLCRHFMTDLERFQKIVTKLGDGFCAIHPDTTFKLQIQTAEIHICRADDGGIVIGNEGLGMDKARGIFINADACFDKLAVIRARGEMDDALIEAARGDDADIDTALGRGAERGYHTVIDDEIGSHDVDVFSRFRDHLRIHVVGDVLIIERRIRKGKHEAIVFLNGAGCFPPRIKGFDVICDLDVRLPSLGGHELPRFQKHQREAPRGVPLNANARILPMTERAFDIDVFVCDIQTARISDLAVDDDDLSVVAVVLNGVQDGDKTVKRGATDAVRSHFFDEIQGETEKTAHIVVEDTNVHALRGFLLQDRIDGIPHLTVFDDEGFDEDIAFRFFKVGKKRFPKILTGGKMAGLRIFIDGIAGIFFQIFDLTRMVGRLLRGFFIDGGCERIGGLCLLRKRFNGANELFGAGLISEQQIKNAAEYGEYQNDKDPRQLIRLLGALGYDMQGDEQADDL